MKDLWQGGIRLLLLAGMILLAAGCGTPPKSVRQDPELERDAALANGAFAGGSAEKAAAYYRKALNRARLMDDPAAIGRNAYNLAACLALAHQDAESLVLLDEAAAEFQRVGSRPCEVSLLQARLAWRAGRTNEALALVQTQLQDIKPGKPFYLQRQILLAGLLCARGDATNAALELARADRKALAAEPPAVQADAAQDQARLALIDRQFAAAAGFQDTAARQFQQAGQYVEMALALDEAGRAYESAGDGKAALDRYYRSARSLFLAGQSDRAENLLARALPLADRVGDAAMREKIDRLRAEIKSAREPAK